MNVDEKLKQLKSLTDAKEYHEEYVRIFNNILTDNDLSVKISHAHYEISSDTKQLCIDFMDITIDHFKNLISKHEDELKLINKEISDFFNSCSD